MNMNMNTRTATIARIAPLLLILAVTGGARFEHTPSKLDEPARLPFYNNSEFTPTWLTPAEEGELTLHTIDPFSLVDQSGAVLTQKDLDGRVYVASFIFTGCSGICPRMVGNLLAVQAAFADDGDVVLISHSVDPDNDTVDTLREYGAEKGIDQRVWKLVTGDKNAIYRLARTSYFADANADADARADTDAGADADADGGAGAQAAAGRSSDDFLHTESVLLIDGMRRIRGLYNGTLALDIERLISDIKTLQASG